MNAKINIDTESKRFLSALTFFCENVDSGIDRSEWIKYLGAIKDGETLGISNEELFKFSHEWSKRGVNYTNEKDVKNAWKSLKSSGSTIKSIFAKARENGWTDDGAFLFAPLKEISQEEKAHQKEKEKEEIQKKEAEDEKIAKEAYEYILKLTPANENQAYLKEKNIKPHLTFQDGEDLIIPMIDPKYTAICSYQRITKGGIKKRYLKGGKKGFFPIGFHAATFNDKTPLLICEGFATGASIHEAAGVQIAISFDAGNLLKIAQGLREQYPNLPILIAGDNDLHSSKNIGREMAEKAASDVQGIAVFPIFKKEAPRDKDHSDFNDMAREEGLERVKEVIDAAIKQLETTNMESSQNDIIRNKNSDQENKAVGTVGTNSEKPVNKRVYEQNAVGTGVGTSGDRWGQKERNKNNIYNNSINNDHIKPKDIILIDSCNQNDIEYDLENISKVETKNPIEQFPPQNKMPCFEVYDENFSVIEEGVEKEYPAGVYHFSIKTSSSAPNQTITKWLCSPLHLRAVTCDEKQENVGRLVIFKDISGKEKEWIMPMELLKSSGDELRGHLLNKGVNIDGKNGKNFLLEYLRTEPLERITTVKSIGWHEGCFILPDQIIGENATNIKFHDSCEARPEFGIKGTLDGWQNNITKYAIGNTKLALAISASLDGALIHPLKKENGGFHIFGHSSTGKTTILAAASSTWGCPNYKRTWRATSNGLEGIAASTNDGFLPLDEISQCDPVQLGDVAYMLGNGSAKLRANRYGGARGTLNFRLIFFSTGEESLEAAIERNGEKSKAGQAIRFLSIPIQEQYGVWDELHNFPAVAELSMHINEAVKEDYGHAGITFLEKLTAALADKNFNLSEKFKEILKQFPTADASGQDRRAIERFALAALAGELATEFDITGWPKETATKAAVTEYEKWRKHRGCGNSEERDILNRIYDYICTNGETLFSWVKAVNLLQIPRRAGWHDGMEPNRGTIKTYYFIPGEFKKILKGFDVNTVCEVLKKHNALDSDKDRNQKSLRVSNETNQQKLKLYGVKFEEIVNAIHKMDNSD